MTVALLWDRTGDDEILLIDAVQMPGYCFK